MLPVCLEAFRQSLESKPDRSWKQNELLSELEAVARALDQAESIQRSITEKVRNFSKGEAKMWGGDPGRCYVCGK